MRVYIYYYHTSGRSRSVWHNVNSLDAVVNWLNRKGRQWTVVRAFKDGLPCGYRFSEKYYKERAQF